MTKASSILICPTMPLRQLPDQERDGKCCTKCGEFKPLTDFIRLTRLKSGRASRCKACAQAWRKADEAKKAGGIGRNIPGEKYCSRCGETKDAAEFYPAPKRKDGLSCRCRSCTKEAANVWAENNRELSREKAREWSAANPERRRLVSALYRERNLELKRANDARHYRENKHLWRLYSEHRRARKQAAPGVVSKDIIQRLRRLQRGKCACCGKPLGTNFHLDHIMPLVLGGRHDDGNLQLLRARCNLQKNKKHPVQFMQERGFLL